MLSKKNPFISIIIPLHWGLKPENYDRFVRDLNKYLQLKYPKFEIIIVTDKKIPPLLRSTRIKYFSMGLGRPTGPAEKRDFVLNKVKGEICAFIDDDAYPDKNWLKNSISWFRNPDIVAVGGPGITPPEDPYFAKIGGYIIESYLCSGGMQNRFYVGDKVGLQSEPKFILDWPAYNLLVRTSILKKVGGYGSSFYGGEDTYLCLKLIKYGRIICDTNIVVYHHRRNFPKYHLKQIASVGKHRGYFFKKYPKTSRSIVYFLPTILTLGFGLGFLLSLIYPSLFLSLFLTILIGVWILGTYSIYRHKVGLVDSVLAGAGIILTHMAYGVYFIRGLLIKKLER